MTTEWYPFVKVLARGGYLCLNWYLQGWIYWRGGAPPPPLALARGAKWDIRDKMRYSNLSNNMIISELWTTITIQYSSQARLSSEASWWLDGRHNSAPELAEPPPPPPFQIMLDPSLDIWGWLKHFWLFNNFYELLHFPWSNNSSSGKFTYTNFVVHILATQAVTTLENSHAYILLF